MLQIKQSLSSLHKMSSTRASAADKGKRSKAKEKTLQVTDPLAQAELAKLSQLVSNIELM